MALLHQALAHAQAGQGQIAGVMGEPGVGKSRLFYEFKLLWQQGCLVLETFSVSHGKAYPYLPLIELLKNYFQLNNHDDERRRREKITGKVLTLERGLEATLPYLFFLLGIAEASSPLQQMDAQIRRKRILEAIKRLLLRESLNQPLMLIFEDLHWLDAETQAFLQVLSESVATARILLLVNYRPEYQHQWHGKTFFSQLRLDPLGKEQAEEMLSVLLSDIGSPRLERARDRVRVPNEALQSLKRFILDKTEGNPFFMEEIVQTLREQGILTPNVGARRAAPFLSDLRLPTTVQGVLSARIDRLPAEEKALLQTLAVIGREFSSNLLHKVVTEREDDLHRLLSRLQAGEFIYEQPAFPEVEYIFKHTLTQEVAYNSLLIERRKIIHERTAQAIEEVYRLRLEDHYSELAYHYSRSGNTQKAIDYLQLAGQQAVQRSANVEAISHLTSALELLKTLPDSAERQQKEFALRIILCPPLMITKGYGAPEVEASSRRAMELGLRMEATSQLGPVLWVLAMFHLIRTEYHTTRALAERYLALAEGQQDAGHLTAAHTLLGASFLWSGEPASACTHLEQGFLLYDAHVRPVQVQPYETDLGVFSGTDLALALWYCGYPDRALQTSREALSLAHKLSHPPSLVLALLWTAFFQQLCHNDPQTIRDQTEAAIPLTLEHGLPDHLAVATMLHGWALAAQGQVKEGINEIRQSLAPGRVFGGLFLRTYSLALLAEAQSKARQYDDGLQTLQGALTIAERSEEHFYDAEVYRLIGELLLNAERGMQEDERKTKEERQDHISTHHLSFIAHRSKEAEECFLKAIEIAQKQQAKSLELRATVSLARLWQQQGKASEAHQMLSEVYNWFTEGFDTKDLQEAKSLLEELTRA